MKILQKNWVFKRFVNRNLTVFEVMGLSLLIATFELVLLEIKYGAFRGGFLQSHSIQGSEEVCLFLLALLGLTGLFIGFMEAVFFVCFSKTSVRQPILVYHFVWIVGGGILVAIGARYELGKYFSDFLDFQVAKNLGGGHLGNALLYVLDEGLVYVFGFLALFAIYVAGHFFMWRTLPISEKTAHSGLSSLCEAGIALILQGVLILAINQNADFRYHLNHTFTYRTSLIVLDWLTDFDQDGYGLFSWQQDQAPFDRTVYPLALDIPGDGIDQDGIGGDFHYPNRVQQVPTRISPLHNDLNVVFIVLESARADALEKTVAGRQVMPNLMRLVQEGGAGKSYYSHEGYTLSSLCALLTGQLTPNNQEANSIFKYFKDVGYQIGIFSGQAESFGDIAKRTGMRRYASYYFDAETAITDRVFPSTDRGSLTLANDRVVDELFKAGVTNWTKPFFIYMNLQAGHFPYYYPGMPLLLTQKPLPRNQIKPENRSRLFETYYNAMAYDDQTLGRIIKELKIRGIYDKTLLVISGDHGESLFDDGFLGHGHFINDIQLRTILVANRLLPGFTTPMGQVDLSRAILSLFHPNNSNFTNPGDEVFHFIGPLNRPSLIGMTYKNGQRVILNLESREIQASVNRNEWLSESKWMNDALLKANVEALVSYWETLRWQDWLAKH